MIYSKHLVIIYVVAAGRAVFVALNENGAGHHV